MSDRGSGPTEAVIPLAPKSNARPDPNDPLDKAGHLILDMVGQAASVAEANYQQAVEVSRNLSVQLRGAEDRIRELEATARRHAERADPLRDGCIRSRWRLSRNFLPGKRSTFAASASTSLFPKPGAVNPRLHWPTGNVR